ncbi:MAG: TlpA family protein disulfide reductase [Bauldia sp.]|nr:TlpA family protein disulfide reductase [Bauldia sp.]
MAETRNRRRGLILLGIAAVAGVLAGTVAVYVRGLGNGNGGTAAGCDLALQAARRVAPLATGEVAAFRAAEAPEQFGDLVFKAPDGGASGLAAFSGQIVLLNLWATWCVPCRAEMPALDRLQASLGGDDFAVVAVNVDVRNEERARAFLEDIGVDNLAFYSDPSLAMFNNLKRRGLAFGLPTSLLLDGKGCGIGMVEGPAMWDSDEAKALIRAAIAPG